MTMQNSDRVPRRPWICCWEVPQAPRPSQCLGMPVVYPLSQLYLLFIEHIVLLLFAVHGGLAGIMLWRHLNTKAVQHCGSHWKHLKCHLWTIRQDPWCHFSEALAQDCWENIRGIHSNLNSACRSYFRNPCSFITNNTKVQVYWLQVPLLPCWAMTIAKCQGQNIICSIAEVDPPPAGLGTDHCEWACVRRNLYCWHLNRTKYEISCFSIFDQAPMSKSANGAEYTSKHAP